MKTTASQVVEVQGEEMTTRVHPNSNTNTKTDSIGTIGMTDMATRIIMDKDIMIKNMINNVQDIRETKNRKLHLTIQIIKAIPHITAETITSIHTITMGVRIIRITMVVTRGRMREGIAMYLTAVKIMSTMQGKIELTDRGTKRLTKSGPKARTGCHRAPSQMLLTSSNMFKSNKTSKQAVPCNNHQI